MFQKDKFKAAMKAAGVTIGDIAETLDISDSCVYTKIKRGRFQRIEIELLMDLLHLKPVDGYIIFLYGAGDVKRV